MSKDVRVMRAALTQTWLRKRFPLAQYWMMACSRLAKGCVNNVSRLLLLRLGPLALWTTVQ
jgi:hypothetical protein